MARGDVAPAEDIVRLDLNVRDKAKEGHTVNGVKQNLLSTSKLVREDYIQIFERDKVSVYDARNTKVTVSRAAVLRGYYHEGTNLWRIPLIPRHLSKRRKTIKTNMAGRDDVVELLRNHPPPRRTSTTFMN